MISGVAFVVIFLTSAFLFMRNYPSDRWFSGVFIVAGGVMAWCAASGVGAEGAEEATEEATEEDKIECFYDKPAATIDATNELDEHHGSNAGQEQEDGDGNGRCERKSDDGNDNQGTN
jgi:hypothetical protein